MAHQFPNTDPTLIADQLLTSDDYDDDDDNTLLDDFLDDLIQDPTHDFAGVGVDQNMNNNNNNNYNYNKGKNTNFTDAPQNPTFGNPIRIPVWPAPPSSYSCTCCQTLREFSHTNGTHVLKLDVHGRLGLISHAVLERYETSNLSTRNHEYHMFDFCQESIISVKRFLIQYCDDRKREGYIMLQDPLSNFYNALCIGLEGDCSTQADNSPPQTSRANGNTNQGNGFNQPEGAGNGVGLTPSMFSWQRKRTANMKLKDLKAYFHLPMVAASAQMSLCASALKGICRKEGLSRWPHRKIKCIERQLAKKQQSLDSSDANERARVLVEIQELQQKLAELYEGKVT